MTAGIIGTGAAAYIIRRLFFTSLPPSSLPPSTPSECRYRLDNSASSTITLPDGRTLGYAQYGSPTGRPILYQHGLPGSRLEGAAYHDLGIELNARIICTDRPGYGWSSPHPGRTLLDWPQDLQYLADHLGLEEYSVLGVSGGGPYTLASAVALPPEKLKCVSLVCGLGPMDIGMSGAEIWHRIGFPWGWAYAPVFLVRWFMGREPVFNTALSDDERLRRWQDPVNVAKIKEEREREIVQDTDYLRLALRSQSEALAQGWEGVCEDGAIMSRAWGFAIEDVRGDLPVLLWYGKDDVFVPPNHGVQIARRVGERAELRLEEDTHGSISYRWKREVLEGILAKM
jgi:pimeloyl-ACP methyl ester carboxylesterase